MQRYNTGLPAKASSFERIWENSKIAIPVGDWIVIFGRQNTLGNQWALGCCRRWFFFFYGIFKKRFNKIYHGRMPAFDRGSTKMYTLEYNQTKVVDLVLADRRLKILEIVETVCLTLFKRCPKEFRHRKRNRDLLVRTRGQGKVETVVFTRRIYTENDEDSFLPLINEKVQRGVSSYSDKTRHKH